MTGNTVLSRKAGGRRTGPGAREGWEDARLGRPFDYAACDRNCQVCGQNYARCRLVVAEMRSLGISVPAWLTPESRPMPVIVATGRMRRATDPETYAVPPRAGWRWERLYTDTKFQEVRR